MIYPFFTFVIIVLIIVAISYYDENNTHNYVTLDDGEVLHIDGYRRISETPSEQQLHAFLSKQFHFYQILDNQEQTIFRRRLNVLLQSKWFIGKDGLNLHDVMILFICAYMVQITFGLKTFDFPRFNKIALFPDTFYSGMIEREVKGLTVYHSGLLIMSWPHAYDGHSNPNDKINLMLHELAHALYLDYWKPKDALWFSTTGNKLLIRSLKTWDETMNIRFYGNMLVQTFTSFGQCVLSTFEAPQEFRKQLPELYRSMSKILNQDIAARIDRIKIASSV